MIRFGSVRKISVPGWMPFGLCFSDASWLGPVRFGSFPRPVPAGSGIQRFGSVRLGWFGSVSYAFLSSCGKQASLPRSHLQCTAGSVRFG